MLFIRTYQFYIICSGIYRDNGLISLWEYEGTEAEMLYNKIQLKDTHKLQQFRDKFCFVPNSHDSGQ